MLILPVNVVCALLKITKVFHRKTSCKYMQIFEHVFRVK